MKTESSGLDSLLLFDRQQAEKEIQRQFEIVTTSRIHRVFKSFCKALMAAAPVVIFGGFVRDGIHNVLHAEKHISRDIDLVVCGKLGESQATTEKNNFGGRRAPIEWGLQGRLLGIRKHLCL